MFDPLVELHGLWTTEFGERYLPIQGAPPATYHCVDGNLVLVPAEPLSTGYATLQFGALTRPAHLYPRVALRFSFQRWIQPGFTVVRRPVDGVWIEAKDAVLVGEFVSPSSRVQDRISKPAICAEAGIPFYLFGQVSLADRVASLQLSVLSEGRYRVVAAAEAGQLFEVDEPFPMSFDPVQLLDL